MPHKHSLVSISISALTCAALIAGLAYGLWLLSNNEPARDTYTINEALDGQNTSGFFQATSRDRSTSEETPE